MSGVLIVFSICTPCMTCLLARGVTLTASIMYKATITKEKPSLSCEGSPNRSADFGQGCVKTPSRSRTRAAYANSDRLASANCSEFNPGTPICSTIDQLKTRASVFTQPRPEVDAWPPAQRVWDQLSRATNGAQVRGRNVHSLMRARFLRKHFARLRPKVVDISQDFLRHVDLSQKLRVSSRAGSLGAADRFGAKRRCGRRPAVPQPGRNGV